MREGRGERWGRGDRRVTRKEEEGGTRGGWEGKEVESDAGVE